VDSTKKKEAKKKHMVMMTICSFICKSKSKGLSKGCEDEPLNPLKGDLKIYFEIMIYGISSRACLMTQSNSIAPVPELAEG